MKNIRYKKTIGNDLYIGYDRTTISVSKFIFYVLTKKDYELFTRKYS